MSLQAINFVFGRRVGWKKTIDNRRTLSVDPVDDLLELIKTFFRLKEN